MALGTSRISLKATAQVAVSVSYTVKDMSQQCGLYITSYIMSYYCSLISHTFCLLEEAR